VVHQVAAVVTGELPGFFYPFFSGHADPILYRYSAGRGITEKFNETVKKCICEKPGSKIISAPLATPSLDRHGKISTLLCKAPVHCQTLLFDMNR
jgi:hypothetical protein